MSTRVQVARSMVWTALESFGVSGLSIIGLIVVAWYISPAQMGVAAMAQGIVQLLTIPVEFLFVDALIRKKDAQQIDFNTAHLVSVLMGLALTLLCWLMSGTIAGWLHTPEMAPVLAWMGLSIAAMGFGVAITAKQRRDMEFRALAIRSFAGRLCGVTVGIIIAVMGGGVWSLVAQQVLMVVGATLVLWVQCSARPAFGFSFPHFKELATFGLRTIAIIWVSLSIPRMFTLFVGASLSTAAAGYLNLAFRVVDILRAIIANVVSQLALPMFARHSNNMEQLKKIYMTAMRFTCAVTFPVFAGLAICSSDFIHVVFGQQWQDATPYVMLLSFLTLVFFARIYSNPILTAREFPHLPLVSDLCAVIALIAGMAWMELSGHVTLEFAGAIWALRLLASLPVDFYNLKKIVHIGFWEQLEGAIVPLIAVLAMVAALYGLHVGLLAGLTPLLRLVTMSAAGACVYALVLLLLDRERITELWHFALLAVRR